MSALGIVALAAAITAIVIGVLEWLTVISLDGIALLTCVLILFGMVALAQFFPGVYAERAGRTRR